jgi:hypothetical protein
LSLPIGTALERLVRATSLLPCLPTSSQFCAFPIPSLQNLNTTSCVLLSTPNTSISASHAVYARYLTCSAALRQNRSALLVISKHLTLLVNLNPMSIQETQSPGSFLTRSDFLPFQNNTTVVELFTINQHVDTSSLYQPAGEREQLRS